MRVEVRLYATLADRSRTGHAGDPFDAPLDPPASLSDLIVSLKIQPEDVHLILVNGRPIHDRAHTLSAGDRVALFPPVGGG